MSKCMSSKQLGKLSLFFSRSLVSFLFWSYACKSSYSKLWYSIYIMAEVISHYRWDIFCFGLFRTWWKQPKQFSVRVTRQVFGKNHKSYINSKANLLVIIDTHYPAGKHISNKIKNNLELEWILFLYKSFNESLGKRMKFYSDYWTFSHGYKEGRGNLQHLLVKTIQHTFQIKQQIFMLPMQ